VKEIKLTCDPEMMEGVIGGDWETRRVLRSMAD
jgi:hypothetical protein